MLNSLPIGRIGRALERLNKDQAWFAILAATFAIVMADRVFPGVGFAPLYIPVTCAACWCLGEREGYAVALFCAIVATAPHLMEVEEGGPLRLLGTVAIRLLTFTFVATTITNFRRLFDRERQLAQRDRMTGALNQECFREQAFQMLERAREGRRTLLLAMLDLDDFKGLNNRHGHAAGDAVLMAFAQGAAGIIRREDEFGRIGGDEFALLFEIGGTNEGEAFATTLHERLSAVLADTPYPVTCSMGALIIAPDDPRDQPTLMHLADMLMYAVKQAGKNAVRIGRATTARAPDNSVPSRLLTMEAT